MMSKTLGLGVYVCVENVFVIVTLFFFPLPSLTYCLDIPCSPRDSSITNELKSQKDALEPDEM